MLSSRTLASDGATFSPLSAAQSCAALDAHASEFWRLVSTAANLICLAGSLEVKLLLGDHLYRDVRSVSALRGRRNELALAAASPMTSSRPFDDAPGLHEPIDAWAWVYGTYVFRKAALLAQLDDHLTRCAGISDHPTRVVLQQVIGDLEAQRAEADVAIAAVRTLRVEALASRWETLQHAGLYGTMLTPETLPARGPEFHVVESAPPGRAEGHEYTRRVLHFLLMSVEVPTIEHCSRLIIEFPEMPWEFVEDMARQCWDEVRHSRLLLARLHELGGEIGDYDIDLQTCSMTLNLPLELRLAVHQSIGEWIGIDDACRSAAEFRANGDDVTAALFDFVAADEVNHVRYGRKWLSYLVPDESERDRVYGEALRQRRRFGETVNGRPDLAINYLACDLAGMSAHDVSLLQQTRRRPERTGEADSWI